MTQQTQPAKKPGYKPTLNLPKTTFAMKANLVQNEPQSLKRWDKLGLYQKVRTARAGSKRYVFHDGPPYANGSIHLGHLLNKVLKDFVVRSKTMAGYDCPYIPGWDCHGLPIEHKVMQELGDAARGMEPIAVRRKCKKYAEKYVKLQSGQMQRLLTLADYPEPYLTMDPKFEAPVLDVFAELVGKGLVCRALKPVHWSIANQTALAEAELEYEDRDDTSVYVQFEVDDRNDLLVRFGVEPETCDLPVYLMIWTTTPWTLPANLAVAVHPRSEYSLVKTNGKLLVIADKLREQVAQKAGQPTFQAITDHATRPGADLVGVSYRHPFIDRKSQVVQAEYVTLEDGTGLVHTAPGHGVEDYQTGLRENLDVYCPVQADGTFDDTAPNWLRGVDVWQANGLVINRLRQSDHLFHSETITHSYPHDWRSKQPVIFRATEQWFISVGPSAGEVHLREQALGATRDTIKFIPEWGRNRMRGMLESRPDWCISRQRAWGLPIPAFYNDAEEPLLTEKSVRAVSGVIRERGSDCWFGATPEQLLIDYDPVDDPDAPDWAKSTGRAGLAALTKSSDIFDVWFESGSSWAAVLVNRLSGKPVAQANEAEQYPADLYLEGSDQHRGWFQLSLLPALGVTGQSPFKSVLTHGFMVDKDGKKMSKSVGNTLEVDELMKNYGADVCRWWVSTLNTENDIKVDNEFFKVAGEEYRKVRNTIRYLLSNLNGFDPKSDAHDWTDADATSLDAWAMHAYVEMAKRAKECFELFRFREANRLIFNFCNDSLSAVYLAAVKDRLYCDAPDSPTRRRTQSAMWRIVNGLIRLLAPTLPHTADEAWRALHADDEDPCVHLNAFPSLSGCSGIAFDPRWEKIMSQRNQTWMPGLEQARQDQDIDNPLDLGLCVGGDFEGFDPRDLADLCGVSQFRSEPGDGFSVIDLRNEPRCDRSWKRDGTVKQRSDGGLLSDRDADALGLA